MTSAGMSGLESVEVLGELALAFGERLSGPGDGRVFPVALGVGVNDLRRRLLEALRCEQLAQPRVHMGEEAVLAYGQASGVGVHEHRIVGADLASVEGMPADHVAL